MPQHHERNGELQLDRVVASQPELGPSIPDGGYGWLILIACMFLQCLIPSILVSYGILILYRRIEFSGATSDPKLSETTLLPASVLYMAIYTIAEPWSITIVTTSKWPRLLTTSGICLACAGLLIQWIAMRDSLSIVSYIFAGLLTGFGSSLILTQSDTLISQYFRLKLAAVRNLLYCSYSLGFIIVPIILGIIIHMKGVLNSLLIYQAILLQCLIVILVFKKPLYLKAERRRYELLQNASEDDEMIFAKEVTTANVTNLHETATSSASTSAGNSSNTLRKNTDGRKRSALLTESFATEFAEDLDRNYVPDNTPKPLFTDVEIRNVEATTYSYDNTEIHVDNDLFPRPPERVISSTFREEMSFLLKFNFYKALVFTITFKYSLLIFWTLFPTYLYLEMDRLKMQETTFLVGAMGLGNLGVALISSFLPGIGSNKQICAAGFSFICAAGFFVLSDAASEGWLLFGAVIVTMSLTVHHVLNNGLFRHILGCDNEKAHTLLHTLSGISIVLLLVHDNTFKNCFRIMALLQLITSGLLFTNFLVKSFKNIFGR